MTSVELERREPVDLRQRVSLVELVDRVLNKGVVLTGDITLAVADVDLVYVGLRAPAHLGRVARGESGRAQR